MDRKVTENTLVPISAVASILGGVFWLSNLYIKSDVMAEKITSVEIELKERVAASEKFQKEVIERLARIEENLSKKETKRWNR